MHHSFLSYSLLMKIANFYLNTYCVPGTVLYMHFLTYFCNYLVKLVWLSSFYRCRNWGAERLSRTTVKRWVCLPTQTWMTLGPSLLVTASFISPFYVLLAFYLQSPSTTYREGLLIPLPFLSIHKATPCLVYFSLSRFSPVCLGFIMNTLGEQEVSYKRVLYWMKYYYGFYF